MTWDWVWRPEGLGIEALRRLPYSNAWLGSDGKDVFAESCIRFASLGLAISKDRQVLVVSCLLSLVWLLWMCSQFCRMWYAVGIHVHVGSFVEEGDTNTITMFSPS